MANLLDETICSLYENGKSSIDVLWCGAEGYGFFSWNEFVKLANQKYDNGFGGQVVCPDLVIVGDNWWLERHEYDGSEWWEFKTLPQKPADEHPPKSLFTEKN